MLNNWIKNINEFKEKFKNGKPYKNVIIPNFFKEEIIDEIYKNIIKPDEIDWCKYHNPIEYKYSLNKFEKYPKIKEIFNYLQTEEFINYLREITEIDDLENDEYLHGAGIHLYPKNGKLDIHLDYNIHPITKKERRINLIIYLNKDWKKEYGGFLKLYDKDLNEVNINNKEMSMWNTAIIFKTNDLSYHGLPEPIKCPDGEYRKSLAIYYVSKSKENLTERYKAEFFPKPEQPINEKLKKLYDIRKIRLITDEDLKEYPNWENDGNGYW